MRDMGHALETLSRAGLRRTPQRLAVIEALIGNESHPTAEDLWARVRRQMPSISLSTVYSTLRELRSLGLVQYVGEDPLRVDPDIDPHIHMTCSSCGRVLDLPDPGAIAAVEELASQMGHTVEHVGISLDGVCKTCRKQPPHTAHA